MACNSTRFSRCYSGLRSQSFTYFLVSPSRLYTIQVALFAVVGVSALNAAQIGLVLTYTSEFQDKTGSHCSLISFITTLTQLCSLLTRQSAEVEVSEIVFPSLEFY